MDDIDREKVDLVVVYKVDRLSRSLLDFARLMERFEARTVGFVSITQHFDTVVDGPVGVMFCFHSLSLSAERSASEPATRSRPRGVGESGRAARSAWATGFIWARACRHPRGSGDGPHHLRAIPADAFHRLRRQPSQRTGLTTKRRVSKKGRTAGGRTWDKNTVHRILRNPLYLGKVRSADGQLHSGEHMPLVTLKAFEMVAESMDKRTDGPGPQEPQARVLPHWVTAWAGPCNAAMTSGLGTGRTGQRYRYYRCVHQQTNGGRCPTGLLVAGTRLRQRS